MFFNHVVYEDVLPPSVPLRSWLFSIWCSRKDLVPRKHNLDRANQADLRMKGRKLNIYGGICRRVVDPNEPLPTDADKPWTRTKASQDAKDNLAGSECLLMASR